MNVDGDSRFFGNPDREPAPQAESAEWESSKRGNAPSGSQVNDIWAGAAGVSRQCGWHRGFL